jgi:glycosyltransferase involved in cell wall biosynthesis
MNLIIVTHEIENESFLINELDAIASNFEKVIVITTEKELPLQTRAYNIIVSRKKDFFVASAIYALGKLFSKEFFEELRQRRKMRVKPSFKTMILSCIASWMIERRLKGYFLRIWKGEQTILYSYWLNTYAYFVAKAKKAFPEIKAISRAHGFEIRDFHSYIPFRKTIDSCLDKIIFISEHTQCEYNQIMSRRVAKKRAEQKVIYLGTLQKSNLSSQKSESSCFTLVSCSGIYPLKRLDLIIDSLSEIQHDIHCKWVHFGTGADYERIINLAKIKLCGQNISFDFKGQLPNSRILKFYNENSVDLFINASDFEGVPVSIMEAMSFGIPCIARNVGGNSEIVKNGISGTLVSREATKAEVAAALKDFYLVKQSDPEKYMSLKKSTYNFWLSNFDSGKNYRTFLNYILN